MNKKNQTLTNKVFKEKKTIKGELEKALEEGITLNCNMLAKKVGISVYRVRKYCKNHNIDLNNYTTESLNQKNVNNKNNTTENTPQKKKKRIKVEPKDIKIKLNLEEIDKIKL